MTSSSTASGFEAELIGPWFLRHCDPGADDDKATADLDDGWVKANAPVDAHRALLALGLIPDPYAGTNVEQCQWVEQQQWWFRYELNALPRVGPHYRDFLRFDGLDTCATVFLDGRTVGAHTNMHSPCEVEISGLLESEGTHHLAVRFDPPQSAVPMGRDPLPWGNYFVDERVWLRKTQAQFSWDHCPRLVNVGLWRPVWLKRNFAARLGTPHVRVLRADTACAVVSVEVPIEQWADNQTTVTVRLTGHGHHDQAVTTPAHCGTSMVVLTIPEPELWWPAGHGAQPLYTLDVVLSVDGAEVDRCAHRVGLRTVALKRSPSPEEPGAESFTFVVNGKPIFAKGASWVPADLLNTRTSAERYRRLLDALVQANGNMIRVWGGGQYEPDAFYDLCDELGILVWQDFMFACARYPDDDTAFVANVEAEARYQVCRLRSHPCMAVWCGSNEIDILEDKNMGLTRQAHYPGWRLIHKVVAGIVAELDPDTPWWPSSPFGGDDHNSQLVGDRHNWTTWHGAPVKRRSGTPVTDPAVRRNGPLTPGDVSFHHLERDRSRFLSEFGIHAAPSVSTLQRYLTGEELRPGSSAMRFRDRNGRVGRLDLLMQAHTGMPATMEEYVTFSMWCQAEGLRRAVEVARTRMFACSGTLMWQWNDAWPGITWSVLDVLDRPKGGYYALKRAFAPAIVAAVEDAGRVTLSLVNDSANDISDTIWWQFQQPNGETISDGTVHAAAAAQSVQAVLTLPAPPDWQRAESILWFGTERGSTNDGRLLFAEIRDLRRPPANVRIEWIRDTRHLFGRLSSDNAAFFVHLDHPDAGLCLDDNWFDLRPGQTKTVTLDGWADHDPSQIRMDWL